MKWMKPLSLLVAAGLLFANASLMMAAAEETEPDKLIALTFDDGPNTYTTPKVLDLLEQYDAKASFFLIGDRITEESAQVARRAYDMGCEIDSHSKTHSDMTQMTYDDIVAEMTYVNEAVYGITGEYPKFFRPPYLNVNDTMYEAIEIPFITGFSSSDSNSSLTADDVTQNVLNAAKDGAIILMHDFYGNDKTVEALGTILPTLADQGYEFVTLSELFSRRGEEPVDDFCYSEVQIHPCKQLGFTSNLFTGSVTGDKDWEGWKNAIRLDGAYLDTFEDSFTIEVHYDSIAPPNVVLHRWVSSDDNLWKAVKPYYYNGTVACFRSEDMRAVLNEYGMSFADMNYLMVRTNWTEMTITQVDLYASPLEKRIIGDVNDDGLFTVLDVVAMQKWLLDVQGQNLAVWENGDLHEDGLLNGFDLALMKNKLLGGGAE